MDTDNVESHHPLKSMKKVKQNTNNVKKDAASHKAQLEALKQNDPDFYAFLQENDRDLLQFGEESDADSEISSDDQHDKDAGESSSEEGDDKSATSDMDDDDEDVHKHASKTEELTKELLDTWKDTLEREHSLRALKKLLVAFRVATSGDEPIAETNSKKTNKPDARYSIENDVGILLLFV